MVLRNDQLLSNWADSCWLCNSTVGHYSVALIMIPSFLLRFYLKMFKDYPKSRKALIPFIF